MYAEFPQVPEGTVLPLIEPQEAGTIPARRSLALRNAAYDHVRSAAERGDPLERSYCSARAPLEGVYACALVM